MNDRTCCFAGCDARLAKKAGPGRWPKWCEAHRGGVDRSPDAVSARKRAAASIAGKAAWANKREWKVCIVCRNEFYSARDFCSDACMRRDYWSRTRERRLSESRAANAEKRALVVKRCKECGSEFSPEKSLSQVFCTTSCSSRFFRNNSPRRCSESGCERPHRAGGLCSMHWRRLARAEGREKNPVWGERRKANDQKRRALKRGVAAESFLPLEVFERDGWVCGLCSDPVDRSIVWPDPLSASLDHVLPLSKGGEHTRANSQLAHLTCNVEKGARV